MVSVGIVETEPRSLHCTCDFSRLFGVGGRVLIVPGIVASTGMPMLNAAGTGAGLETALLTALNSSEPLPRR